MTRKKSSKNTLAPAKTYQLIVKIIPRVSFSSTSLLNSLPSITLLQMSSEYYLSPETGERSSKTISGDGLNADSDQINQVELLPTISSLKTTQRYQAIPILSLIHSTNTSPHISLSDLPFDFSQTPSESILSPPSTENEREAPKLWPSDSNIPLVDLNTSGLDVAIEDTLGKQKGAKAKANSNSSGSQIGDCSSTKLIDYLDYSLLSLESRSSDRIKTAAVEANESSFGALDEKGNTPIRQPAIRRTNNPNVKTTKTGKILHKSKKAGVSRRLTAYDKFLQQRSKDLADHNSGLTAQQRMKVIAQEWAVSDKNKHKTRRKSQFLGLDGELHFPLVSSQYQTDSTIPHGDPSCSTMSSLATTSSSSSSGSGPSSVGASSLVNHTLPIGSSSTTILNDDSINRREPAGKSKHQSDLQSQISSGTSISSPEIKNEEPNN